MGQSQDWIAVREVVEQAIADRDVLAYPPTTTDEWGYFADTMTDHIVAAFNVDARA